MFPEKGKINSLLDGNPGYDTWHFAPGLFEDSNSYWLDKGIPSYAYAKFTQVVSLWVKLPLTLIRTCRLGTTIIQDFSLNLFGTLIILCDNI